MAQLTGKPIQNSYLGLIKTTDNAAAGVTPKVLTDGAGNALPMEIGTQSVLFPTGTVDFTGSTVQGLPATTADIPNIANGSMQASLAGYAANTYWTAATLTAQRPSVSVPAIDQGPNAALLVPFNIDSNQTVTTFGIPMQVLANDTLHVAVYEQASNGGPGVRVLNLTKSITTADNNTWVEVTAGPWTPTQGKLYWIGAMTNLGNSAGGGLGYISGDSDVWQRFTTTNNSSVGSVIAVNTLYHVTGGTMPTDLSSTSFNHRDERAFYAWK
jgi:hypothetical protein